MVKKYSKYFYWVMLVINIVFATYFIRGWLYAKPTIPKMPDTLLTENDLVKAEVLKLSNSSDNKQIAMALMSSRVNVCADNKIVDLFRATRLKKPNISLFILFSKNMSDQDISTFKDNFKLDFEVMHMSPELDDYWERISQKYDIPGIIILSNQDNMFTSQNLSEITRKIDTF